MTKERANRTAEKTERNKAKFLRAFVLTRSVTAACKKASIGRTQAYQWRKNDADLREAWLAIEEEFIDDLEDSALKRATEGWDEPIMHNGKQVGTKRVYSPALTIFMLKMRRRKRYLESQVGGEIEAEAKDGKLKVRFAPIRSNGEPKPEDMDDHERY